MVANASLASLSLAAAHHAAWERSKAETPGSSRFLGFIIAPFGPPVKI
jgi:hypothetical protein